jgi:hypothetical protein
MSGDHKIYYCTKHAEPKIVSEEPCELQVRVYRKYERNNGDMQHTLKVLGRKYL